MKIIIIGGGNTTYFLAKQYIAQDYDLTLINRNAAECRYLSRNLETTIINGDGSEADTLKQADILNVDVLLALTPHDHDNLIACQIAAEMFSVPRTIALVNNPDNEDLFKKLGISVAFSATRILAGLLEEEAGFMAITNMMALGQGKVSITEILLPDNTPADGKTLLELNLPEKFLIASIIRNGDVIVPRGPSILHAGDQLILIGDKENFNAALEQLI